MLEDGPPGIGFTLSEDQQASYLLGDTQVTRNHQLLKESGVPAENLIFYRLNGRHSTLECRKEEEIFFSFSSIGAHDRDNDLSVVVSEKGITLLSNYTYLVEQEEESEEKEINEIEKKLHPNFKRTYLFQDYPYLSDLAGILNQDAAIGLIDVIAKEHVHGKTSDWFVNEGEYRLSGGTSSSSMCLPYGELPDGYEALYWPYFEKYILGEDYDGDSYTNITSIACEVVHFSDIQLDKQPELALFAGKIAEQKTKQQDILCTALFQASPVPKKFEIGENEYFVDDNHYYDSELAEVVEYLPYTNRDAYVQKLATLYSEEEKEPSFWQNIQVVIGEDQKSDGKLIAGSIYHALNYLSFPFYLSLSNQELIGFTSIKEELPKSLIATLNSKGYICIVPSIRKNTVCSYVQNMAYKRGALLENFNNQRLISYLSKDIKELLDGFVGNTVQHFSNTDIKALISQYLNQFLENEAIAGYTVALPIEAQTEEGSFIEISLSLYNEVREVKSQLSISKEGWEADLWNLTA